MTDKKTISVYDSQVADYAELVSKQPEDDILMRFIKRLNSNDFVLDLGCGPATSSATMREHGLRVDPTDASSEMVKLANQTHDIGARQLTFNEVDAIDIYDGIWASFSLLHATHQEFPAILKKLHIASKPNALFQLGMKTGVGSRRDSLDRYYSYYSEEELRSHLQAAGFSVKHVQLGEAMGLAGDVEPWASIASTA